MNTLYYGDNLDILRRYIPDESVNLVYLDPPFKSDQDYNVLFAEQDGTRAAAQIKAFEDTWRWDQAAAAAFEKTIEAGGPVSRALQAFRIFLGDSDMLAYLAMMAPRLVELYRVLKPSGSLYLHCDPTASHYLKMLLDATFGPRRFMNEVCWKRSSAHSDTKQGMRRYGKIRDLLLVYTKSDDYTWDPMFTPYTAEYLESEYRHIAPDGRRYKEADATAAKPGGDTEYDWPVKRPIEKKGARWEPDLDKEFRKPRPGWEYKQVRPYEGRYWAYSKANLIQSWKEGRLIHRSTGAPRLMLFADDMPGIPLQDLWTDIPPESGERDLGYLRDTYGPGVEKTYRVIGEPVSLPDAETLAKQDPYQFQWWALGLVGARPGEQKKGADKGIDGRLYFHDEPEGSGKTKQIILSVKSGGVSVKDVRDLRGVIEREKAEIGVLITLEQPTKAMRVEAASAGFYKSFLGNFPRLQVLTIEELLAGKGIVYPHGSANVTFKKAPKAEMKGRPKPRGAAQAEQLPLASKLDRPYKPNSN